MKILRKFNGKVKAKTEEKKLELKTTPASMGGT